MKRLLLLITVVSFAASAQAQDIVDPDGPLEYEGTLSNSEDDEMKTHIDIYNSHTEELTYKVYRDEVYLVPGSGNKFCWGGVCYDLDTDESILTNTIAPGEYADADDPGEQFQGYYYHNGTEGCSVIRYCFYDVDDPALEECLEINYKVDCAVGVSELSEIQASLGVVSPNPVTSRASFTYDFGFNPSNGKVIFYNMIGKKVKEIPARNAQGVVFLDGAEFAPGMYFYSLSSELGVLATKKMLITK